MLTDVDVSRLVVPVDLVEPRCPDEGRRFNAAAIEALAASIRRFGQLQPVIVRRGDTGYQIVCGERRWRAVKLAGLASLWVEECSASDLETLAIRLADNLHHMGLNHAERIAALDQLAELVDGGGLRETARQIGMDPGWLSRQLGVRADPVIFPALEAGHIGFGQAAELRRAPVAERSALLQRILAADGNVSTATIRGWVAELRNGPQRLIVLDRLVEQVRTMGAPGTPEERAALQRLATAATLLLEAPSDGGSEHRGMTLEVRDKVSHTEVKCLMCGELVGLRDEAGTLRVTSPAGVERRQGRTACGRCGGSLTDGDLRVEYHH
jgi:ParB/RepB/Spo0J family partition protein